MSSTATINVPSRDVRIVHKRNPDEDMPNRKAARKSQTVTKLAVVYVELKEHEKSIVRALRNPSLEGVRQFVVLVDGCIAGLNQDAGFRDDECLGSCIRLNTLQSGFPALVWSRHGDLKRASDWIIHTWTDSALTFGAGADVGEHVADVWYSVTPKALTPKEEECEFLAVYNLAVSEILQRFMKGTEARVILRRLMTSLDLTANQVGKMFRVSGQVVRSWERADKEVPDDMQAKLVSTEAALTKLLELFRPERLPQVVRRGAKLFDGQRALDLILRGCIADVAAQYEAALAYQA